MTRVRAPKNELDQTEPEQQLLAEIHDMYTQEHSGLIDIANMVKVELLPPRMKITVLMIGNHSAGKSSFINWYVGEKVQRVGVAMETSGFAFITSGKRRETLTGEATIELLPHMKGLEECAGVADCISTEIITSKQKKFPMVTFVDTPGLIDGENKYPYDIDNALLWLGRMADLVFVFFDPIGQALRKHTLDVVEKMCSDSRSDYKKMRFYLSKADTAGTDAERQKVITQMAKDLYGDPVNRPGMAKVGTHAEVPTIYIPKQEDDDDVGRKCPNAIDDVEKLMEWQIKTTVQNTLNTLKTDATMLASKLEEVLKDDDAASDRNMNARLRGFAYMVLGILFPLLVVIGSVIANAEPEAFHKVASSEIAAYLITLSGLCQLMGGLVPTGYMLHAYGAVVLLTIILISYSNYIWTIKKRLTYAERKALSEFHDYLSEEVIRKQKSLYKSYLELAVGSDHKQ